MNEHFTSKFIIQLSRKKEVMKYYMCIIIISQGNAIYPLQLEFRI